MSLQPRAPSGARRVGAIGLVFATCAAASVGLAQSGGAPGDWPTYSRDLAGTRYSPLTEITRHNVGRLVQAWSVPVARSADDDDEAPGPSGNPQATPIVVDGVMYVPVRGHEVLALDAATGEEMWRTALPTTEGTEARGVAYWPGDGSVGARILVMSGPTLVALEAATGAPARGFGRDGVAQVVVPWRGVPLVYGNLAILGARTGELNQGLAGDTRAYDLRTGQLVWTFHTVPLPGETGHETWLDHGWRNRSGANVWAYYMTLDAASGILYMPVSSAAGNYWGGDRPGSNLFGNSIVAVDASTGRYRWHFQTVHHDLWDLDLPNPPVLVDIERDGRPLPALASIGKTAYVFILDRATGEPVFGVEERPVPEGSVPDEWYSPTQPFPVKPAAPWRASRSTASATWCAPKTRRHSTPPRARRSGSAAAGLLGDARMGIGLGQPAFGQQLLSVAHTHHVQDASFIFGAITGGYSPFHIALDLRKRTQEFRFVSPAHVGVEWLVGAFYTQEDGQQVRDVFAIDTAGRPIPQLPLRFLFVEFPSQYEEVAGFGSATLRLTDRFDVTAGVRWARNR